MFGWFKSKEKLERLKERYTYLMRKSYKVALKDERESDRIQQRAKEIFDEIKYLSLKNADK
ncbi:Lacal_2735 family protein [Patiriisocius hiemis]|uniref:Lacal_2735 family protein n=1 Tax=Patiriisocius hiemis TaxID=3075604 RepID=A0ABU2YCN3_9FLAO|nr:Lacal_2735 family protein [Constantimarinum sp. W242]MDT0555946.1 Lacal_2735 family protein [Constantimarinum sp. W242]